MSNVILSKARLVRIIKRIAYQIIESNMDEEIVLVGIEPGGRQFAYLLTKQLHIISEKELVSCTLSINKVEPLSQEITLDGPFEDLAGKTVILCDDVLNSGKTLAYSLSRILTVDVQKVETAVLVKRTHSRFPIDVNYKGYELSTTIHEHVVVDLNKGAFLR